jgi:hypothetical protein
LNQDQRRSLIKTSTFFYLNKWDLNNSYLDNQQLFEANSKSSEPLQKKLMEFLLLTFENTLAELVQMKEYPNTGLKKAFIKQSSVYKQQEGILSALIYGNYFQYFSSQLYSIFQPVFI